jgi:hypothetical protein
VDGRVGAAAAPELAPIRRTRRKAGTDLTNLSDSAGNFSGTFLSSSLQQVNWTMWDNSISFQNCLSSSLEQVNWTIGGRSIEF